jgi:NAD-dependent dihydropyrimidine dehydrogenase PreA subunit
MSTQPTLWKSLTNELQYVNDLGKVEIHFYPEKCKGVWQCYNVCPVGCWTPDYEKRVVVFHNSERCIACNACVLQCPEEAIELR